MDGQTYCCLYRHIEMLTDRLVSLSFCISPCLSVYFSACKSHLAVYMYVSVYMCPSVFMSVHLSICLSLHLYIHLSLDISWFFSWLDTGTTFPSIPQGFSPPYFLGWGWSSLLVWDSSNSLLVWNWSIRGAILRQRGIFELELDLGHRGLLWSTCQ